MSLHHGLTDSRDNHLTYFTDVLYSSMVPGILPSQRFCLWAKPSLVHNCYCMIFRFQSKPRETRRAFKQTQLGRIRQITLARRCCARVRLILRLEDVDRVWENLRSLFFCQIALALGAAHAELGAELVAELLLSRVLSQTLACMR